jgi:hypothetical protein
VTKVFRQASAIRKITVNAKSSKMTKNVKDTSRKPKKMFVSPNKGLGTQRKLTSYEFKATARSVVGTPVYNLRALPPKLYVSPDQNRSSGTRTAAKPQTIQ